MEVGLVGEKGGGGGAGGGGGGGGAARGAPPPTSVVAYPTERLPKLCTERTKPVPLSVSGGK
jgi:hypothetical protein